MRNGERMMSHTQNPSGETEIIILSVKIIVFEDSRMNFTNYRCVACTPSVFSIFLSPISFMLPESFKWVNKEVNVFSIVIVNIIFIQDVLHIYKPPFKKKKKQYLWVSKMPVTKVSWHARVHCDTCWPLCSASCRMLQNLEKCFCFKTMIMFYR